MLSHQLNKVVIHLPTLSLKLSFSLVELSLLALNVGERSPWMGYIRMKMCDVPSCQWCVFLNRECELAIRQ